jgi:hypothetical protein
MKGSSQVDDSLNTHFTTVIRLNNALFRITISQTQHMWNCVNIVISVDRNSVVILNLSDEFQAMLIEIILWIRSSLYIAIKLDG